jgi:hypothetical protein
MKKFLLSVCICAAVGTVMAQDMKEAKLYVPAFEAEYMEGTFGTIYGVSANGEYAVGYDDFLGSCAFMWSRYTGKFEEVELASMLLDVANDGTAVGNYWVEIPGADGNIASRPGYYKDGVWSPLPILRNEAELTEGLGESDDMNGCAVAISADKKFIAGYITDTYIYKLYPALWQWNEETQGYDLIDTFESVQESIDLLDCPYGWVVKDMSDDGSIITGFSEWGSGARSASVIINGQEKRLTCLRDPLEVYEETGVDQMLDTEGIATVSDNGLYVAGYYAASANLSGLAGFTWTPNQESVAFVSEGQILTTVDNNGVSYGSMSVYGAASMYKEGVMTALRDVYAWESPESCQFSTIFANSAEGEVLGGIAMVGFSMGAINIPAVLVTNPKETDAVEVVKGDANHVYMASGWAFIDGEYNNARVYNVQGAVVAESTHGNIDMNNLPAGVYVVCVDGVAHKVIK